MPGRFLAEFVIVVLGVVVALGVDEWRQLRVERVEEASYYERLAADMATDMESWRFVLSLLGPKVEALDRITGWLEQPNLEVDRLRVLVDDIAMASIFSGSVPPSRRSTYTEILSTGKLDILSETDARTALIDYHFAFDNLEVRMSSRTTGYESLAYELVPRSVRDGGDNFAREALTASDLLSIASAASGSRLRALVVAERNRALFIRGQFEDLLETAETLYRELTQASL